jgi:hypothetical protein
MSESQAFPPAFEVPLQQDDVKEGEKKTQAPKKRFSCTISDVRTQKKNFVCKFMCCTFHSLPVFIFFENVHVH